MATYAIGDIQGCFDEFCELLKLIAFNLEQDQLWFVGDLVNRGPKSLEVLRFVKALGESAKVVLGNHDLHLLAIAYGANQQNKDEPSLKPILDAPDREELLTWLKAQPLVYHDEVLQYTLVHAGLPPQWDLPVAQSEARKVSRALQGPHYATFLQKMYKDTPSKWSDALSGIKRLRYTVNALTRMRFCDMKGQLKLKTNVKIDWGNPRRRLIPWFKHPDRRSKELRIIFGHWAALGGITFERGVHALDTGCVWGGFLTAMRLEDNARFAVQA